MKVLETVDRVRPAEADEFGDPTGAAGDVPIPGARVFPRSTNEGATDTNMVIDSIGVLLPLGAPDVDSSDQLRVRGILYSVTGKPYATAKGTLVYLTGTTGA